MRIGWGRTAEIVTVVVAAIGLGIWIERKTDKIEEQQEQIETLKSNHEAIQRQLDELSSSIGEAQIDENRVDGKGSDRSKRLNEDMRKEVLEIIEMFHGALCM